MYTNKPVSEHSSYLVSLFNDLVSQKVFFCEIEGCITIIMMKVKKSIEAPYSVRRGM